MLRRGGRGNDGERSIGETKPGELAVECIACPQPGVNLPDGWHNAPSSMKFLYALFLAFDACFRLKRKHISSWNIDPSLQDGWAYFVEHKPYMDWVKKMETQKEMSTCTGLAALDHANTKYNEGYADTGKAGGLCARHEILWKNGMGATQVGEKYANSDFIVASILRHISILLIIIFSYDIVCQWSKKLINRLKNLPPMVRLNLALRAVKFVIPKLHILGHLISCQAKFSLSFTAGAGQTDAESIERLWSGLGGVSTSIKEMGPGSHQDTLEDHIGYWNWNKVINMGDLLKKRLTKAVAEYQRHYDSWVEFTQGQKKHALKWKVMVDEFEAGVSEFNPYAQNVSGKLAEEVRRAGTEDAAGNDDNEEDLPDLETSPGEFLYFGLEIEHQQRELRQDISAGKNPTNKQLTAMLDRRTKLTRKIRRFRALQLAYMPVALHIIATLPQTQTQLNVEEVPLYLPSRLSDDQRKSDLCRPCLPEMELRLRDGQLNQYLNQLRQALLVKQRMFLYKKRNARNQGPTTRSRDMLARQDKKVQLAATAYQEAWNAKKLLVGGDESLVGWRQLLREHIVCMEDLDEAEQKKVKAMKRKKNEAERRILNGENPVTSSGPIFLASKTLGKRYCKRINLLKEKGNVCH
ncbi:hypothetical protein K435DRAFT_658235 [Dendrothele bispora CBS 962.96]|uniref:CxC2-like cysteine cluster KDZ transposase-associated domain-containing protein n=1 Tax=Dendrothele bispora (strain CBS 962.96) TaxID=1314807 RepID=A0A4S8MBQ7_DENBC|nr:hypothetical protein K435DRAFT_658235 [Dendrothele bispora CBS 962.96]